MMDGVRLWRMRKQMCPAPVRLPPDQTVIALGGDLKSTVSVMRDGEVHTSEVCGDLADADSYRRFTAAADALQTQHQGTKLTIIHDMHPGFLSTAHKR